MLFNMKPEPKKKLPNKKVISSAKFEAKEQFTKSALENLKTEKPLFGLFFLISGDAIITIFW